jgi:hypothetical protein
MVLVEGGTNPPIRGDRKFGESATGAIVDPMRVMAYSLRLKRVSGIGTSLCAYRRPLCKKTADCDGDTPWRPIRLHGFSRDPLSRSFALSSGVTYVDLSMISTAHFRHPARGASDPPCAALAGVHMPFGHDRQCRQSLPPARENVFGSREDLQRPPAKSIL